MASIRASASSLIRRITCEASAVRWHHITATRTRVSRQNNEEQAGASAMRAMRAAGVASVPEWHSHGTAAPPGVREYCYVVQPAHCTDAAVARNGQCNARTACGGGAALPSSRASSASRSSFNICRQTSRRRPSAVPSRARVCVAKWVVAGSACRTRRRARARACALGLAGAGAGVRGVRRGVMVLGDVHACVCAEGACGAG